MSSNIKTGMVTSVSGAKTVAVTVSTKKTHPVYKKRYPVSVKFLVHDEKSEAAVGDTVTFKPGRKASKRKSHELVEVVARAPKAAKPAAEEKA